MGTGLDERAALAIVGKAVGAAGDDAAVVDGTVITTDMLHERTDFPAGTTRYTAGWRAVGASLSDVAAMGAAATAAVAVYATPAFDREELDGFLRGATDVCERVDAAYVGGDLDTHDEFTVATTAVGETDEPVYRRGAAPGDRLLVTGSLGRSGAALRLFEDDPGTANELFRFVPRVAAGRAAAPHATAMMDSSDGLARSLHQLAVASDCGFDVSYGDLPIDPAVDRVAADDAERRELGLFFGEDFELVVTAPADAVAAIREASPTPVAEIGTVTDGGVCVDGDPIPDRGYTHGAR